MTDGKLPFWKHFNVNIQQLCWFHLLFSNTYIVPCLVTEYARQKFLDHDLPCAKHILLSAHLNMLTRTIAWFSFWNLNAEFHPASLPYLLRIRREPTRLKLLHCFSLQSRFPSYIFTLSVKASKYKRLWWYLHDEILGSISIANAYAFSYNVGQFCAQHLFKIIIIYEVRYNLFMLTAIQWSQAALKSIRGYVNESALNI